MEKKFHPAMAAIQAGDLEKFRELLAADPSLATTRSMKSHPTLLQCLVLDGKDKPNAVLMAKVLIDASAELDEPLVAAASIGTGGWTPLEEALYWDSRNVLAFLLERGAKVQNIRTAAGLGRTDLIEGYFNSDGSLKVEAGRIDWPFGKRFQDRINAWSQDRQGIINNAFVYACMHGHIDAAKLLLEKGAQINVIPGGFDYAGTGLHYAALNGHRSMVEFLIERSADIHIKDTKVAGTAAGWAEHGGHAEIRDYLVRLADA